MVQKPNWTETKGQKWECVLRYTDFLLVPLRKNQKVRVPEYTFSLLPLNLRPIWLPCQFVGFRFFSLNKVVERNHWRSVLSCSNHFQQISRAIDNVKQFFFRHFLLTSFSVYIAKSSRLVNRVLTYLKPYTLIPEPYTLNPTPQTLHPKPYTPNPTPWTLNPEPWTPDPTTINP